MTSLHNLSNFVKQKRRKRVGRGSSSGVGKTSGRGEKGDGSRSGYKRRYGRIGGAMPLHMKMPIRGFSRKRFQKPVVILNLSEIQMLFKDGETVSLKTLKEKQIVSKNEKPIFKVLSKGDLDKKVKIEATAISKQAIKKLEEKSIPYKII